MLRLSLILVLAHVSTASADTWTQFRGESAGKLTSIQHPVSWSSGKNVAWSLPLEGSGWSSPVVANNRIFVTSAISQDAKKPKGMMAGVASMRSFRKTKPSKHKFLVSCLNLDDGQVMWRKEVTESTPPVIHPSNTYATESPATDGERLFSFFAATGTLTAWDFDGNELWRRELGSYKSGNGFGTGSSLAILDGSVFVQYDNDEKSFVAAFDGTTGKQLWQDDRPTKTSWSTPLVWSSGERKQLVTCGSDVVTSYNPTDGAVIWRLTGMQSAFSASPAIYGDRIYFGNSGPMSAGPLVALDAGLSGEVALDRNFEHDKIAWSRTKSGPGMASPVVSNGFLYIPGSGGILNCYDQATGKRIYRTRVPNMKTVAASLWGDEEQIFILDESGVTHVIRSGPKFELLGSNVIDDLFWSTPAIAGRALLLRGVNRLYCIRE